jgi:sigma-B regulation protein RsbU (phosphoserine phosphatase)
VLLKQSDGEIFLTLFYGILDLRSGAFQYSAGGQPPPLLCSPGQPARFLREPRGMMLGMLEEASYASETVCVEPGGTLVLYTDGVTEAENQDGGFFSEKRLEELTECMKHRSAGEIATGIVDALDLFADGKEKTDDITLLTVRYAPGERAA